MGSISVKGTAAALSGALALALGAAVPASAQSSAPPDCGVGAGSMPPPAPRSEGGKLPYGFNLMVNGSAPSAPMTHDDHAKLERRTGATVTRMTVSWGLVEYYRDHFLWGGVDQQYCTAVANGLRPLFVVLTSPRWAVSGDCGATWACMRPPDRQFDPELQEFARALAQRYPQAMFEAWNEPNWEPFWGPDLDPVRYTEVLKAIHQGVKAGNPAAPVAGGALMNAPYNSPAGQHPAYRRMDSYLWSMYRAGAGQYMDAVAVHAYPFKKLGTPESRFHMTFDGNPSFTGTRKVMAMAGHAGRPIWITEFGVRPSAGDGWPTEEAAAADILEMYRWADEQPDIHLAIWHTLLEDWCTPGTVCNPDRQPTYSWLRQVQDEDGVIVKGRFTPRPSYCAFTDAHAAPLDCTRRIP